jgi:hypothetical protein
MNAHHIGYIAVTSSVFLYKLSIREGGALPLAPTSITVGHTSSLWRGGGGGGSPSP